MNEELMTEAFNAIREEALKLLQRDDLPDEVEESLDRILALADYQFDIRSEDERRAAKE